MIKDRIRDRETRIGSRSGMREGQDRGGAWSGKLNPRTSKRGPFGVGEAKG